MRRAGTPGARRVQEGKHLPEDEQYDRRRPEGYQRPLEDHRSLDADLDWRTHSTSMWKKSSCHLIEVRAPVLPAQSASGGGGSKGAVEAPFD
jgi:hypothetical protein